MTTASAEPKLHGNPIADTAIRQPVFITMMMLLAVVVGLLAYTYLSVNYLPDISVATVSVSVSYSGAGQQTMADQVAKPIEDTLTTINGIDHITTNANEGSAQITVQFQDSVDPNQALQSVRDKVNAIVPRLPNGVGTPVYRQFDPNDLAVLQLAVNSDGTLSPLQLRTLIEKGREVKAVDYQRALRALPHLVEGFDELFTERYDAIVTPAALGTAPKGLSSTGDPVFCSLWTLTGMPALSLPLMQGANGLPLGVQLVGRRGFDARLFRTARWLAGKVS